MQIVTVVQRRNQTVQTVLKYTKLPAVNLAILCPVAVVSKTVLQQKMLQDVAMAHMIAMMDAVAQENVVNRYQNVLILDIMVEAVVLHGADIPRRNARENMPLWALVATKVVKLAQDHAMSTPGADAVNNVAEVFNLTKKERHQELVPFFL